MNRNKYIKSSFWYVAGNLLIKGISFFTLPLFTRLLGITDFGRFNIFMSYENVLNIILGLGIAGTIKTAYFDYKDDFRKYFSSIISLVFLASIFIGFIINILFIECVCSYDELWNLKTINLLVVCSLATALYNLFSMKYVIDINYKVNLGISFAYTLSSVLTSVGLCYFIFADSRYLARIVGNTIPLAIITFILASAYIVVNRTIYNKHYWLYALKMGVPLIFHSLSLVIMQQADKIMVNAFCGDALTGIYSLACNISIILTIIQSSVDNSWSPWFYRNLNAKNYVELIKINNYVIIAFMYLTCGFILISPDLINITSPVEYHEAIFALIPLNISVYISFMYMFSVNKEYYFKNTKIIAFATVIATIIDVILNYSLIPIHGYISAAYTTLIAKMILFIIHWYTSNRIDSNRVVSIKFMLVSFVIVCFASVASTIFINNYIIRYFIIITITVMVLFFYRKQMIIIKT